jgi:hypothetical protein
MFASSGFYDRESGCVDWVFFPPVFVVFFSTRRIGEQGYVPTETEVLRARQKSTGITGTLGELSIVSGLFCVHTGEVFPRVHRRFKKQSSKTYLWRFTQANHAWLSVYPQYAIFYLFMFTVRLC